MWLVIILFIIGILLEGVVTTLPFVLVLLIVSHVLYRKNFLYVVAILAGIILDFLSLRTIGFGSVFFVLLIFIISLYEKKFEIKTAPFLIGASFLASSIFLFLFKPYNIIIQALIASLGTLVFYKILKYIH